MHRKSRREFVCTAGIGAAAAAGLSAPRQDRPEPVPKQRRQIIPGSPSPAYSRAVRLDDIVWVAGVVGQNPDTGQMVTGRFEAEVHQALENLKASAEASGSSMANVLKCTVFLTDGADFPAFNQVYTSFFPKDPPARSTVVVKALVVHGARLEIDCVAFAEKTG